MEYVYYYNCRQPPPSVPPLPDIEYRSSERELDVLRHVYRWDNAPYDFVFTNGFIPRRQGGVTDATYFNVDLYVHHGGRPLDIRRETNYSFVSTTLNSGWVPSLRSGDPPREVYRYEIYAPGGVLISETLGKRYQYPSQDEVCYTAGIAPQYIRSAQLFRLSIRDGRFTRRERVNQVLIMNRNFNPQTHPPRSLKVHRPVVDYIDANKKRQKLQVQYYPPSNDPSTLQKREANSMSILDYYTYGVADEDTYIDSAFRSRTTNQAYIFMGKEYVLVDYASNTRVNGPLYIRDGFKSLGGTTFGENGIDCAFGVGNFAYIFSGKVCAKINYAPGATNSFVDGPKTIAQMFPFLRNTGFENGIEAAFESTVTGEAYIFRDKYYALINYDTKRLIATHLIKDGFHSLANTIFASGIGAAFASHRSNEAYLFKGQYYALLQFTPGATNDKIIGGVKEIRSNWNSLKDILPRKNRGLDIYDAPNSLPERDHDEF